MTAPLCAACTLPTHAGPCHNDPTAPLHARIADLERQLAAAITHPLAVAAVEAYRATMTSPGYDGDKALANDAAQVAWEDAGYPVRTTT